MRILKQAEQYPWRLASVDPYTGLWREQEDVPPADLHLSPDELSKYFNPYNDIMPGKLESIRQNGGRNGIAFPVQVDTDGTHARINDGHHRVTVAQEFGLDRVPVILHRVDGSFFKGKKPEAAPLIQPGLRDHLNRASE